MLTKLCVFTFYGFSIYCWACQVNLQYCVCLGNPTITPRRVLRSKWFQNPWACGSYSHPRMGCTTQDLANMMEPLPAEGSLSQVHLVFFFNKSLHNSQMITVKQDLTYFLPVSCGSAPAGVVCWRGDSSHLLLYRSWSCSFWVERSWKTHFALPLYQPIQWMHEWAWMSTQCINLFFFYKIFIETIPFFHLLLREQCWFLCIWDCNI